MRCMLIRDGAFGPFIPEKYKRENPEFESVWDEGDTIVITVNMKLKILKMHNKKDPKRSGQIGGFPNNRYLCFLRLGKGSLEVLDQSYV